MKKAVPLVAIVSIAFTFACAPKKSATHVQPAATATAKFESPKHLKKALASWQVSCASSADCPDYVAHMIAVSGDTATLCTASLIAPDVMLTNSHCLDDKNATAADLCKTTKFIFADKSKSGPESVACKEIISKSKLVAGLFDRPDYMVIRLDHALTRQTISVARDGLQQHEILNLHKVDPDKDLRGGTLLTAHCKALQGTAFLPDAAHDTDPVMITRDCDIIDGNSGSPLVDANGKVAAIAFASVDHDAKTVAENAVNGNTIDETAEKAEMAHVTNLACIDLPGATAVPAVCTTTEKTKKSDPPVSSVARISPNLDPKANWPAITAAIKAASQSHKELIERKLGYRAALSPDNASVEFVAFCFNLPNEWLAQYEPAGKIATTAPLKPVTMKWHLGWTLDDDLKAVPQLTEAIAPTTRDVTFSPAALKKTGQSEVKEAADVVTWQTCPLKKK